jgi:hypothetical protein
MQRYEFQVRRPYPEGGVVQRRIELDLGGVAVVDGAHRFWPIHDAAALVVPDHEAILTRDNLVYVPTYEPVIRLHPHLETGTGAGQETSRVLPPPMCH